jgi:hypothetical protein
MIPGTRQDTMIPAARTTSSICPERIPFEPSGRCKGNLFPVSLHHLPPGPGMNDPAVMTVMILLLCKSLIDTGKHDRMP